MSKAFIMFAWKNSTLPLISTQLLPSHCRTVICHFYITSCVRLRQGKVKEVKVSIISLEKWKNKIEYETASDSFYCSVYLILVMIDHFLGNTTRLNLLRSTEFYIVIGSVRKTWLFFKLQLKKVEVFFSSLIIEFITKSRTSSYVPSYISCFSFSTFPSLHLV